MRKLNFSVNKTLRLNNVLKHKILMSDKIDFDIAIQQMQTYIRTKGNTQIGPLIQHTRAFLDEREEMEVEITIMMQCSNYIYNVEAPYSMESVVRVSNTLYCRYIGPEENMKFAHDKIQLEAFESDIPLKGDSYTIFVEKNEEDETIIADVFMERAD